MYKYYTIIIGLLFVVHFIVAKDSEKWVKEPIEQLHIGNFSLPTSQQPGPLVGFGQNIIDQGDCQLFAYVDQLKGKRKDFIEVAPSVLYGLTNKFSLFVELAIAAKFEIEQFKSRDFEDLLVQLEGVVYAQETAVSVNEITLVANMGFPTGAVCKQPATGFGAPTFFLGFTASHTATDWYYFTAGAVTLTTRHKNIKFGNQFLYQFGISKNICSKTDKLIFNWMVELDGFYRQRNQIIGVVDGNSGGNTIVLGPSLWLSTQRFIAQAGISAVVFEHLFGVQSKNSYFLAASIGWKF